MHVAPVALDGNDAQAGLGSHGFVLLNRPVHHLVTACLYLYSGANPRFPQDDSAVRCQLAEADQQCDGVGSIKVHQQPSKQDPLELAVEGHSQGIPLDQFDVALPVQAPPSRSQHASACVNADDSPVALSEQLCPRPGTAPDIEHRGCGSQSGEPPVDHNPLEGEAMLDTVAGQALLMSHVRSRFGVVGSLFPEGTHQLVVEVVPLTSMS